jgi:hypothetical protein
LSVSVWAIRWCARKSGRLCVYVCMCVYVCVCVCVCVRATLLRSSLSAPFLFLACAAYLRPHALLPVARRVCALLGAPWSAYPCTCVSVW